MLMNAYTNLLPTLKLFKFIYCFFIWSF